jgi:predicted permease
MPDWRPALRARLTSLQLPEARKAQLIDELAQHLDDHWRDLQARGLPAADAVAATLRELDRATLIGTRLTPPADRPRLFRPVGISWLDVKLGVRMMLKHRALSLVSVVGMAVAIAIGAGYFAAFSTLLDPALPLDEGDRIVAIQNVDVREGGEEERILHDFLVWREELRSVNEVAAMRIEDRNLIVEGRSATLIRIAKMTAAGFRVARVAPVLGRPIVDADERPGAPPVLVIAEEVWRDLFDRDPGILGRSVGLGRTAHTIVGVMPAGFRFPLSHRFWVPLQTDRARYEPGAGPPIHVFGRLADGVTIAAAEAELATIAARLGTAFPAWYARLRPQVLPYTYPFNGLDSFAVAWWVRVAQFAIGLLVALVAVNVAILIYARTAARAGEIAVRTALGASRRRVVAQLFTEALVLSGIAAVLGLGIAAVALSIAQDVVVSDATAGLPFWVDLKPSPATMAYVAGLAIVAGVIVGVVPGLKATGRRAQSGLQQISTRASHPTLGRVWTALIVTQVAMAVAILPFALHLTGLSLTRGSRDVPPAADALLTASVALEPDEAPPVSDAGAARRAAEDYRQRAGNVLDRLEAEPLVAGVTFGSGYPGREAIARVEVEPPHDELAVGPGDTRAPVIVAGHINQVDTDFFDVLDVPILDGRGLQSSDTHDASNPVVVDRVFADAVLGGRQVLGRRIRRVLRVVARGATEPEIQTGPWLRIAGIVPDIAVTRGLDAAKVGRVYQPVARANAPVPLQLMVRVRNTAPDVVGRIRNLASQVDAGIQLRQLRTVPEIEREAARALVYVSWAATAVAVSVLLLSAAGIYSMMSFIVARRRREIGIRTALGASPRRLLGGIFARAAAQLGTGVLCGLLLAAAVDRIAADTLADSTALLLPAVAALMFVVGVLAALEPARRLLALQPTEALRED